MKIGILIIGLAFIGLTIGAIFVTKGLIYKYVARIKSNSAIWLLTKIHFISSLLFGFFLPNNYLNEFPFINNYYEKNGIWIPVSIFGVFIFCFIIIGVFLNILFLLFGLKAENIEAYEKQKNAFPNYLKKIFDTE